MNDNLGDRMKMYEGRETNRTLMPGLPVYARLDGRGFSRFTKGMERPWDRDMATCMTATMAMLIDKTHATVGYTQSDEISLVWLHNTHESQIAFNGKIQKLTSVLASLATAVFMRGLLESKYADRVDMFPHFDCRIFNVPNEAEAANAILWRELDATKNAISMAASTVYSHKELHKKNSKEKQEMLFAKGINFNDYDDKFKRGIFAKRVAEERLLTDEEWERIPEPHRGDRDQHVTRSGVRLFTLPRLLSVENRNDVLFRNAEPIMRAE